MRRIAFIYSTILLCGLSANAQPAVLDEIIGIVGNEIILHSDVQIQKNQLKMQGMVQNISDCAVLEEILFEKILLNQAKVDSIEVSNDMVNGELDKRIDMFVRQIGSVKALEEYYAKSVGEIREEFFDMLKDQLLVQRMESEISSDVNVTPSDVQAFFNSIPIDSLPFVSASVELAMIAKYPKPSRAEVDRVRNKLREFKERVEKGKDDFETLSALYSEDPGSSSKGGSLGLQPRGTWVPEFDAVAFGLQPGQVSQPFKTDYGWHIMQLVERRGELYNANHILLIPKVTAAELTKARTELDSIRTIMMRDSLSFPFAASKFSDDERTKNQNGLLVNPNTGSTIFPMDQLDPTLFMAIDTMEIGQVSKSFYFQGLNREKGYRIVKLVNRTEPHRANLVDDYQSLQSMASEKLKAEKMDSWMRDRIHDTYIKVKEKYHTCPFGYPWVKDKDLGMKKEP
jgi:peptidyl-prolyl cis-trans isomerase SurA